MRFSTPYHLETATPSDLPTLAEIETEAVLPSALNTVFFQSWADTKVQAKFFQSDLEAFLAKPDVHIIKVLNTITGEIEGFMVRFFPFTLYRSLTPFLLTRNQVWYVIESTTTSFSPRSKTLAAAKFSCTPPATLSNPSEALNSGFCSVVFPATEQLKADLLQGQKCACESSIFSVLVLEIQNFNKVPDFHRSE